tara:strand:- start:239 stop:481 length:243 start_codon:yes stop_codon:yes gene_type:complete
LADTIQEKDMKATIKNLNAYIQARYSDLGLEFVKGEGYFYFVGNDDLYVESIMVYALNRCGYAKWCEMIDGQIYQALLNK